MRFVLYFWHACGCQRCRCSSGYNHEGLTFGIFSVYQPKEEMRDEREGQRDRASARFARCRRKRRRLGRQRDIHRVKEHLGLELVLCFVESWLELYSGNIPTMGGSSLFCSAPHVPLHNPCGSGGLQCTIFEQLSYERDSIARAKREREIAR